MPGADVIRLVIPRWHPATKNQLRRGVRARIRLKKADRAMLCAYAMAVKVPRAQGKRRISLHIVLGKGQRGADTDGYWDSLLDGCKHAGLIVDDSHQWVELAPVLFSRDPQQWGTVIEVVEISRFEAPGVLWPGTFGG